MVIDNDSQEISNYNEEDLRSHNAISSLIYNETKTKILMQDHVNLNLWTIPVGKVEPGETIEQGLKAEMGEECGIVLIKFKKIFMTPKKYFKNGKYVKTTLHGFEIEKYKGTIKNLEPKKHRTLKFINIDEVRKLGKLSDATLMTLKYLKK